MASTIIFMPKLNDLTGMKFGRWTVISLASRGSGRTVAKWNVACECGSTSSSLEGGTLRDGKSKSCGCLKDELHTKHGGAKQSGWTREYRSWMAMKTRCNNPNHRSYHNYGGRGIKVCGRRLKSFNNFLEDMGLRPTPKHSLDRVDNNGNYCKENCRWATYKEQCNNTRKNVWVSAFGETKTVAQWAAEIGVCPALLNADFKREKHPESALIKRRLKR